jgi:hypothetical protein
MIVETENVIKLTKFDVAERQINQAIRLFFLDEDPVSIRTLIEAAGQIFYDIGRKDDVRGMIRDKDRVRPEYQKMWFKKAFEARNFFKHAENDPDGTLEFKTRSNESVIVDAILMYNTLKKGWSIESLVFFHWFGLKYPNLLKKTPDNDVIFNAIKNDDFDVNDKSFYIKVINMLKVNGLPGVSPAKV